MADHKDREVPDDLSQHFPAVPPAPEIPEAPELKPVLPPHPSAPKAGAIAPGSYRNTAIAATAATSFIMPVIVLSVGGYYLDRAMHHQTAWFAMLGVILGLVTGVAALLRVIGRLSD